MKSIITLIVAILAVSGSFASNDNHKDGRFAFYKSEETVIFNPSVVLANHVLSVEDRISADQKIIGVSSEGDLKASAKSIEEIIIDDQRITEAVIPAIAALDKKTLREPVQKFANGNLIFVKN